MVTCGLNITHDAAVAVIDGNRLIFSVELEKLQNNPRYAPIDDLGVVPALLAKFGLDLRDVQRFVVGGWHGSGKHLEGPARLTTRNQGVEFALDVAGYNEAHSGGDLLSPMVRQDGLRIGERSLPYRSYLHTSTHVMGAYCSSPYAARGESAYVLVWDGGQYPLLYFVDARGPKVVSKGRLFLFLGTLYGIMGQYFGPYKKTEVQLAADREQMGSEFFGGYSIAGKVMSYMALGQCCPELLEQLGRIHQDKLEVSLELEHKYARAVRAHVEGKGWSDADVLRTNHQYIENLLVEHLRRKIHKDGLPPQNFCFSGGAALNIVWNSAIRAAGIFRDVWVPPVPNDSGSALGVACCEMVRSSSALALDWNVYAGAALVDGGIEPGWSARPCTAAELGALLAAEQEPVVVLHGRAELGPRALGNRSILAPATDPAMKDILNRMKQRESFRPVAPLCLEGAAPEIFDPGCPDPYMLFNHYVRPAWRERIPAIRHLDETARLQTVDATQNATIHAILDAYLQRTGIPVLCNTSANFRGRGFFPDARSAMQWGQCKYVWSEGTLFERGASTTC